MRKLSIATGLAAAILLASGLVFSQPKPTPEASVPAKQAPVPTASTQVERGRYLVQAGDCIACHTKKGGERFAGGRPLETPFGTVLSANLTPDVDTGIGRYTPDTFYRALHEGKDRDGRHLYPAFPYNYYTQVTREDTDAIFAYLRTLPPVRQPLERNQLPFPFNIRALMFAWNLLFLDEGPYRPDTGKSADWNRGAYLVSGLGHCEACHSPKNILGAAKKGEAFRGGVFADWFAPDITANKRTGIGNWSDDELKEFLHRGLNVHSAAAAEMGEVVAFSTSQLNDADQRAVITYLRGVQASPAADVVPPGSAVMAQGQAIWQDSCAACHQADGQGVPRMFPPLKGDANLQQSDPTTIVHFILAGGHRTPTETAPTPFSMPAYSWKLSDAQVAAVATFARNSWGNAAPAVQPELVAKLRKKLGLDHAVAAVLPVRDLRRPGPATLAPPGTDSRDNGTPQAGRAAPAQ